MNLERLDEIRELFAAKLNGSGIREPNKTRVQELFNRVADAHKELLLETSEEVVLTPQTVPVHIPRTAAESEAVIAAAQGNHIKAVETPAEGGAQ